jgi:hypothetical protein
MRKKYPMKTATAAVRYLMQTGAWWTEPTMQRAVRKLTGRQFSGSSITARIRGLRPEVKVISRLKDESTSFEYRIAKKNRKQEAA